jgi:hypothetical protein
MKKYEALHIVIQLSNDVISTSGVITGAVPVPWGTPDNYSEIYDVGCYPTPQKTSYNIK